MTFIREFEVRMYLNFVTSILDIRIYQVVTALYV